MSISHSWDVLSPLPPVISANVTLPYFHNGYRDKTGIITSSFTNTELRIRAEVTVILLCIASYPVLWLRDGLEICSSKSCPDPLYPDVTSDNLYHSSAIRQEYNASLRIHPNGSNRMGNTFGNFSCVATNFNIGTSVNILFDNYLILQAPASDSPLPKLLASGFENVSTLVGKNVDLSFIFTGNSDIAYFVLPNGHICPPSCGNEIWMHVEVLSNHLRKAVLSVQNIQLDQSGKYQFFVGNDLEFCGSFPFTIFVKERLKDNSELGNLHTYHPLGAPIELSLVLDTNDNEIEIEAFVQLSPENHCQYQQVKDSEVSTQCGVISTVFGSAIFGKNETRITMLIVVRNSCKFTVRGASSPSFSIIAVDSEFPALASYRQIIPWPYDQQSGTIMFTNSTFTLPCVVPACGWEYLVWCRRRPRKKCILFHADRGLDHKTGTLLDDPAISLSYNYSCHQNRTITFALIIAALQPIHTGIYECAAHFPGEILSLDENPAEFDLVVADASPPTFLDGQQNFTQEKSLILGETDQLICPNHTGVPPPSVSWYQRQNEELIEIHEKGSILHISKHGIYECWLKNQFGSNYHRWNINLHNSHSLSGIAICIYSITMVLLLSSICVLWNHWDEQRTFKKLAQSLHHGPTKPGVDSHVPLNEQIHNLPYKKDLEKARTQFEMESILGNGYFGTVHRGVLTETGQQIAIKIPNDSSKNEDIETLLAEMKIMAYIPKHSNVLELLGHCTCDLAQRSLFLLLEYCDNRSLLDYLKYNWDHFKETFNKRRDQNSGADPLFNMDQLLGYAYQATLGMEHLALLHVIHRDLALRNLLLTSNHVVKVSDFGMSRCYRDVGRKFCAQIFLRDSVLPIWWMALECLSEYREARVYTQKSDVWSFGVVLWEMFSCQSPNKDHNYSHNSLIMWLNQGNRLAKPQDPECPDEIHKLMQDCWQTTPDVRPSFGDCKRRLRSYLRDVSPFEYILVKDRISGRQYSVSSGWSSAELSQRATANPIMSKREKPSTSGVQSPPILHSSQDPEDRVLRTSFKQNSSNRVNESKFEADPLRSSHEVGVPLSGIRTNGENSGTKQLDIANIKEATKPRIPYVNPK